jgi:hypothetical protein
MALEYSKPRFDYAVGKLSRNAPAKRALSRVANKAAPLPFPSKVTRLGR